MVLLKSVVEISARPMPHPFAEFGSGRSGIGIMAIRGDPIRSDASHRLGRSKECPGGSKVTMLAQHDVNQSAVAINRAIQIPPSAPYPDIRLINVPAWANSAFASPTQVLGKCRRQLCLPIAHRFIAEDEPRVRNISAGSRRLSLYRSRQNTTSAMTSLGYCARLSTPPLRSLNCLPQVPHRYRR